MTRKKTTKEIPDEILLFVLEKVNTYNFNHKTGQWAQHRKLEYLLKDFIVRNKQDKKYTRLTSTFSGRTLIRYIQRALNQTTPYGATKEFRDLLCLFASDGIYNWNGLIENRYPHLSKHQDLDSSKGDIENYLDQISEIRKIAPKLIGLLEEIRGEPEEALIKKQISNIKSNNKIKKFDSEYIKEIPAESDPYRPEFPPKPFFIPSFPASLTRILEIENNKRIWIKDESTNPTGTHKDRMAWEITLIMLDVETNISEISLISSGSAAIAIQTFFNLYKVKTILKVLVDKSMSINMINHLEKLGCKIYITDLSLTELKSKDIKKLTDNISGIDITYRENMDIRSTRYYDWLSYEILNESPDYCFIPFGTGDLYVNILNILLEEIGRTGKKPDSRFRGNLDKLKNCNFIGATTNNKDSKLDKLFSYFLPYKNEYLRFIDEFIAKGCFGQLTSILNVDESFVQSAYTMAHQKGITCEYSGIAGLALYLQLQDNIPADRKVLIINTGCTSFGDLRG